MATSVGGGPFTTQNLVSAPTDEFRDAQIDVVTTLVLIGYTQAPRDNMNFGKMYLLYFDGRSWNTQLIDTSFPTNAIYLSDIEVEK